MQGRPVDVLTIALWAGLAAAWIVVACALALVLRWPPLASFAAALPLSAVLYGGGIALAVSLLDRLTRTRR